MDLGRGVGGLGGRVGCWSRRWDGGVVGHDLDPQVVAAARRELEVPSHGYRTGPGILSTAAAEDAPRDIEADVATAAVDMLRERTRGTDRWRRQVAAGAKHGKPAKAIRRHARLCWVAGRNHPGVKRVQEDA